MQSRVGARPYRVETLLNKDLSSRRPSEALVDPVHDVEHKYEAALASEEGAEFAKEGAQKGETDLYATSAQMLGTDSETIKAVVEARPMTRYLGRATNAGAGRIQRYLTERRARDNK